MEFEKAYDKLIEIRDKLDTPEITLDESIKLYSESVEYTKICLDKLKETDGKISVIKAELDKLVEKPLDVEE